MRGRAAPAGPRIVDAMSNTGDNGSWTPQGDDPSTAATPQNDPWAAPAEGAPQPGGAPQPAADPFAHQNPYGQPNPYGQASPYAQASSSSASDPFGQSTPYGQSSSASASDPFGQASPYGQPSSSSSSASDPYAAEQHGWTPAADPAGSQGVDGAQAGYGAQPG